MSTRGKPSRLRTRACICKRATWGDETADRVHEQQQEKENRRAGAPGEGGGQDERARRRWKKPKSGGTRV